MNDFKFQKTNYPKIYNGCYWGHHSVNKDAYEPLEPIIINRNSFVETYNIKKSSEIPCSYQTIRKKFQLKDENGNMLNWYRDHTEYYKTNKKETICIFSQYVKDKDKKLLEANGYIEIAPMYDMGQNTYMKMVN